MASITVPQHKIHGYGQTDRGNTTLGEKAGKDIDTGTENTAIGSIALEDNSSGSGNTAIGRETLMNNQTGNENTAVGKLAMAVNTSGGNNVAIGNEALRLKNSSNNVAIGHEALYTAGTGNNVAVGRHAGYGTTSSNNTFIGYESGINNTSGINTAVGHRALRQNEAGTGNVAVGNDVMYYNNGGSYNVAVGNAANQAGSGSRNVHIGQQTGGYNTGTLITAVGNQAAEGLANNTNAGSYGTFIGAYAGQEINTGQVNNFFGYAAGKQVTTGGKNTIVGSYQGNGDGLDIRTVSNNLVLSDGDGNILHHVDALGRVSIGSEMSVKKGRANVDPLSTGQSFAVSSGSSLGYTEYVITGSYNANIVTITMQCPSYFQAEVIATFQQSNGGSDNNVWYEGVWSNNHTAHLFKNKTDGGTVPRIGFLTSSTVSYSVGVGDAASNTGKLIFTKPAAANTTGTYTVIVRAVGYSNNSGMTYVVTTS